MSKISPFLPGDQVTIVPPEYDDEPHPYPWSAYKRMYYGKRGTVETYTRPYKSRKPIPLDEVMVVGIDDHPVFFPIEAVKLISRPKPACQTTPETSASVSIKRFVSQLMKDAKMTLTFLIGSSPKSS